MPFADMMEPPQSGVQFQQAGQYAQAMSPQQPQQQEGPPTTPQELEQRKSGWQDFITKLQTDPAMRQAALLTATSMMRGPGMGESGAGAMGRALQTGILAHGFFQGNQTGLGMEKQKLQQQQDANDSNIAQNNVETQGMTQAQQFNAEAQPGKMQLMNQEIGAGDFAAANRQAVFDNTMSNDAVSRKLNTSRANYQDRDVDGPGRNSTVQDAAAVQAADRRAKLLRTANPPQEGETDAQYNQRMAQAELDGGEKNTDAVKVQAAQKVVDNTEPGSDEHTAAMKTLLGVATGKGRTEEAPLSSWQKAQQSVKVGEQYKGPDGKTYIRKQ